MIHYLIELALWMLLAYFIGCLLGWILRNLFAKPAPVAVPEPVYKAPAPVVTAPVIAAVAAAAPIVAAVTPRAAPIPVVAKPAAPVAAPIGKMERPKGIAKARGGKADNLQRISGIGPKNESILHTLGFFHFDQIAEWTKEQVSWVDDHLRFNGRIGREEWIKQARLLADGKEAEFTKQYGTGGLRNTRGETLSGTRTRK